MSPDEISRCIQTALPGAVARVHSEDNVHFSALVIAEQFGGLRTLARHQLVYRALGGAVGAEIHALSLDTLTPGEWAERGGA